MKRFVTIVAGVLGGIGLVVGVGVAVFVGPGDVVQLPAQKVAHDGQLIVTSPQLLRYTGTTLRVTAAADRGAIFVGAAHPVDVASYVGKARAFGVDQVDRSGEVSGRSVGDPEVAPPARPAVLGLWTGKAEGTGEQVLDVALTGAPVQVVVQSQPGASVTLGLGATLSGAFALALVVAGLGLLVVAAMVGLGIRRRRHTSPGAADGAGADAPPSDRADESATLAMVRLRVWLRVRRVGAVMVLGAAVPALSGCLALPAAVPAPAGTLTKTALPSGQSGAMLADYDRRNNAVIAGLAKKYDEKAWDTADSGPVLAGDRFSSALRQVRGEKGEPVVLTHTAHETWSPDLATYPMWAFVTTTTTVRPAPTPVPKEKPAPVLHVFERKVVTGPWTMREHVPVDTAPAKPLTGGSAVARPTDVKEALASMKAVQTWLETGAKPTVTVSPSLTQVRTGMLAVGSEIVASTGITCRPYLVDAEPQASLRVVRTSAGSLAVMTLQCQASSIAPQTRTIGWTPEYAKALGTTDQLGRMMTRTYLVTVALEARGSAVRVTGATGTLARSADVELP